LKLAKKIGDMPTPPKDCICKKKKTAYREGESLAKLMKKLEVTRLHKMGSPSPENLTM
jgi:hypothetical protein